MTPLTQLLISIAVNALIVIFVAALSAICGPLAGPVLFAVLLLLAGSFAAGLLVKDRYQLTRRPPGSPPAEE